MDDFLLDCCFRAVYEGLEFDDLTPRYAKWTLLYVAYIREYLCEIETKFENNLGL
jgi:hypothetical protein